ncbi:MAG TPA: maltose alpha-D-glucosyltransferase [Candidatus Binataceae bacterium]|nr:maltose alpha-D-glucosyltransferase [Candidatus Binataceae bacterium]
MKRRRNDIAEHPLWYKDAVFYEVRVRSYYDASGDGIGDFAGLTKKLDYLKDLGVTTLWLLPFYPSALRDDGYDISDYMDVHPDCGTLHEFKSLLREAHRRGLRVVTELVINHTSDQHPWFQRARRAPKGDPARDFYVWSDAAERYPEARIIFSDFETSNWTWDTVAKAYFWHRFYSHQPDLNFDNPEVRKAVMRVLDFWFEMGVDGLRLDAVPYLYERDGTNCENLQETHAFLRELRAHVDSKFSDRMLLAEANQWPEDAVAYLDQGKECHMAFHFPLMPRIFMAVRMEDRFPVTDIWAQTPAIDETCQWALFLRNHDELTLEMVTDEERDYMYRAYAQESRMRINLGIRRRLAPLLGNNRRAIELVNGLLFSLPGTPVLYYGDEIGMGDNVYLGDRDGVRTPMQWSGDRNAGFSTADSQRLILPVIIDHEYHYQTLNVESQERNRHSLLWWIRRLITLRKQFKAFGRGTMEFLSPNNPRVLAFIRSYGDEQILVVANLSRFVQYVELDLSRFKGMVPVELFGRTHFPMIGDLSYLLTLGPHMFDWFSIEPAAGTSHLDVRPHHVPQVELGESWDRFIRGEERERLEAVLPEYLPNCRWFRSKARNVKAARIGDVMPMAEQGGSYLSLVDVEYTDGEPETYIVPLAITENHESNHHRIPGNAAIAHMAPRPHTNGHGMVVYDATGDPEFEASILDVIERKKRLRGSRGEASGAVSDAHRSIRAAGESGREPHLLKVEQTNSSIAYGHQLILKLFRRMESGVSPDLEIGRFLTERSSFAHVPQLAGWLEYKVGRAEPLTMGVMHGFVHNHGDAWEFTRRELNRYFERAATRTQLVAPPGKPVTELLAAESPDRAAADMIGAYLEAARLLGRRTAELHLALASDGEDPAFSPEPFLPFQARSVYQSMRNLTGRTFRLLRTRQSAIPEEAKKSAARLIAHPERIGTCFDGMLKRRMTVERIRTHGDLHLGQVLYTGKDFVIIDFEGEPARPLTERRRKRPGLRDVAGMLRSFHYAAFGTLLEEIRGGALGGRDFASMEPWARLWQEWISWAFLKQYLETAAGSAIVPKDTAELRILLDAFVLDKAIYELGYELNNRPDWVTIPLHGIEQIVGRLDD